MVWNGSFHTSFLGYKRRLRSIRRSEDISSKEPLVGYDYSRADAGEQGHSTGAFFSLVVRLCRTKSDTTFPIGGETGHSRTCPDYRSGPLAWISEIMFDGGGETRWNAAKVLDSSRLRTLGWKRRISLEDGIQEIINGCCQAAPN